MKKYSTFIFDSYEWTPESGTVKLHYSLDDEITFTETLTLPEPPSTTLRAGPPELEPETDRALFALHLIGGISYYKTCLPRKIEIRSGTLSPQQAEFWNTVYENGLGEFFYKNDVDFRGLVHFPCSEINPLPPAPSEFRDPLPPAPSPLRGRGGVVSSREQMYRYYRPSTVENARGLRQYQTKVEDVLWEALRKDQFHGLHFRRQHPIGKYVLDFFCDAARLGIELDGSVHDNPDRKELDADRTAYMALAGIRIIRFSNKDVFENLAGVLASMEKAISSLSPPPRRPLSGVEGGGVGEGSGVGVFNGRKEGSGGGGVQKILIPLGGGKDSIVTTERLRGKADLTLFRMGHHPLIDQLAKTVGLPLLTINRALSPELFTLNEQGALNGHIPITAYLSFVTILIALLYDFDAVAMSTERSANFGNVEFKGKQINHQWSKSEEFERLFREYVSAFITNRIDYFSPLRSMTELQVTEIFVKYPQYFQCTTSCNTNWKILSKSPPLPRRPLSGVEGGGVGEGAGGVGVWCGRCPKCAFVFTLYAAFLPKKTLLEIFDKNLFDDAALIPLYKELLGLEGFKPFECVGTPEETKEAFTLATKRGDLNDTPVMKLFLNEAN